MSHAAMARPWIVALQGPRLQWVKGACALAVPLPCPEIGVELGLSLK